MTRKITCTEARLDMAIVGSDWLGLVYYRVYANPEAWITFRGLRILWFTFAIKIPAIVETFFENKTPREPW